MKLLRWIKNKMARLKEPKFLLVNLAELALVVLAVFTFAGEAFIGRNLDARIFFTCLCVYLVYPLYKLIDHVMKTVSEVKNGIFNGKDGGK